MNTLPTPNIQPEKKTLENENIFTNHESFALLPTSTLQQNRN